MGAQVLFYPTAIGWHPAEKDEWGRAQVEAWQTIQRSHAIANGVYVAAVNRVGSDPRWRNGLPARGPDHYLKLLRFCHARLTDHFNNPNLPREGPIVLPALARQCEVLEAHWPELESICQLAPWTITHGDFVIKNMRVRTTPHGPDLLAYDWEYAGSGMPNIDLAQFIGGVASPDLQVYRAGLESWSAIRYDSQVQQLAWCGAFFRLLESIYWAALGLTDAATIYLAEPVSELRDYSKRMAQVLDETGWMISSQDSMALPASA